MLRLGTAALFASVLGLRRAGAETAPKAGFQFIVVNDTHWTDRTGEAWFAGLAKQMKSHAEKPELVLLAGQARQFLG